MLTNYLIQKKNTIKSDVLGEEILNLSEKTYDVENTAITTSWITIDEAFVARPDLLSFNLYGTDAYGDLICKMNGVSNPFEMNDNRVYRVIPVNEVPLLITDYEYGDELIDSGESVTPYGMLAPKEKKEKRAANEEVVGDERFEINYGNRVVIY